MIYLKTKTIDYCSELINKIDIQCEKSLLTLNDKLESENERQNLNLIRDEFIKKVKDIEIANVKNLTNDSKNIFEVKFCFLIQNYKMIVDTKDDRQIHGFGPAYHFHFDNKIGKLVIVNKFLNDKIIHELNEIINQKRINFRKDEQNLSSFEELVKISALLDLLEKKFEERTSIIDLTDIQRNQMNQFYIYCEHIQSIKETDFDCLQDFIDVSSVREFHLSHNNLRSVPNKIFENFKNITDLDLNCQQIECLYENNFSHLEHLITLSIINCSLFSIQKNSFNGLRNLKTLILTMNYIEEINTDIFNGIEGLEHLNMSQNTIEEINENTFSNLKNLNFLMLADNRIKKLEKHAFFGLKNLKILDLNFSNSELQIDPNAFDSVTELEILDLGNNKIVSIDNQVFEYSQSIQFLNLRNNCLTDLDFLNSFKCLEFLDISSTNMNNIIKIFDQFENISSLKFMILYTENVSKFTKNLENLQGIEIKGVCSIEENAFEFLKSLDYFKMTIQNDCVIENFNSNHFNGIKNLNYLSISTESIGPRAINKFRDKEDIILNMLNPENQFEHKVFYLNFDDSNLLAIEAKDCGSERIYFENNLNVSVEVRHAILRSFYADCDFCSDRLRNNNFLNY